jgi:hypothetical protein
MLVAEENLIDAVFPFCCQLLLDAPARRLYAQVCGQVMVTVVTFCWFRVPRPRHLRLVDCPLLTVSSTVNFLMSHEVL